MALAANEPEPEAAIGGGVLRHITRLEGFSPPAYAEVVWRTALAKEYITLAAIAVLLFLANFKRGLLKEMENK